VGIESSRRSDNSLEGDSTWWIIWISFDEVTILVM